MIIKEKNYGNINYVISFPEDYEKTKNVYSYSFCMAPAAEEINYPMLSEILFTK